MNPNEIIIQKIKQQKMLPLFYHSDVTVCLGVMNALYAAGIRIIEFTNRGEAAEKNFKAMVEVRNQSMKDLLLSIGTIRNAAQANAFMEAGADFLISPVFDSAVCAAANNHKKLLIPGCMTPTEIHVAENAGCQLVKLFPGNLLGPSFVNAIKELFPVVDFIPTGGVEINKENLEAWFVSGVCAVGMGSKLISKKLMDARDFTAIENETRIALQLIQTITQ